MHISDGILSPPVLAGGAVLAVAGVAQGLCRTRDDEVPKAALLTAAFFVGSLVHIPVGPTSAHLLLNGLMGILLGWTAFPALLIGVLFQALFFGHGGISALGVHTVAFATPAVAVGLLWRRGTRTMKPAPAAVLAGVGAGICVMVTALIVAGVLVLSGSDWLRMAQFFLVAHIPVIVVEGFVTFFAVAFLVRSRPALFRKED